MGRREEPDLAALLGEREDVTEGRSLAGGGGTWGRRNWRRMLSAVGEERAPLSLSPPIVSCGLVCSSPSLSSFLYSRAQFSSLTTPISFPARSAPCFVHGVRSSSERHLTHHLTRLTDALGASTTQSGSSTRLAKAGLTP
jgi:hypothetical protein